MNLFNNCCGYNCDFTDVKTLQDAINTYNNNDTMLTYLLNNNINLYCEFMLYLVSLNGLLLDKFKYNFENKFKLIYDNNRYHIDKEYKFVAKQYFNIVKTAINMNIMAAEYVNLDFIVKNFVNVIKCKHGFETVFIKNNYHQLYVDFICDKIKKTPEIGKYMNFREFYEQDINKMISSHPDFVSYIMKQLTD